MDSPPPRGKKFYLYGFPIAQSTAPVFHNHFFKSWHTGTLNTYETWSTSRITDDLVNTFFQDDFGGAAVTMPLQRAILSYSCLEISPESKATEMCNTIVKVPTINGFKLVGQNTQILGVRNSLIGGLRLQFPTLHIPCGASYHPSMKCAGLVVGGGVTARSAIYALSLLGLHPIFLLNRDDDEIECLMALFPKLTKKGGLIYLKNPTDVERYLEKPVSPVILMVVGAVPSVAPVTVEEHMVHTTLSAIFKIPYKHHHHPPSQSRRLPLPSKPLFLEMTSTPRVTPLLQMAAGHGWFVMDGIKSMIEQRLAQQRMWFTSTPTLEAGSAANVFDPALEASVIDLYDNFKRSRPRGIEIDRARSEPLIGGGRVEL
ncbi:hypothetical protein BYT27DRAFT_7201458 [Phlegmacium glaucopus]|nr:hypothetical protein BYT27DRAFT_7201458 [Phlegmacium glaucopus]